MTLHAQGFFLASGTKFIHLPSLSRPGSKFTPSLKCPLVNNSFRILRNERSRAKAGHIYYRIICYGKMYGIFIKIIYTPSHMYTNENVQPVLYGTRCEVIYQERSEFLAPSCRFLRFFYVCVHTSFDSVNNWDSFRENCPKVKML